MSSMVWSSNLHQVTKQLMGTDLASVSAKKLMEALSLSEKKAVLSTLAKGKDNEIKSGNWL